MPLSGKQVLELYLKAGWIKLKSKSGKSGSSHVKVGKGTQRETIPMHKELAKGLERKLLKRIGH
ncbi:MAG: type II toxin-antitoxin system HicA family toxin [Spirochaetia bacterium]|jgi:predicted RNA binding protein YcfA (HicA-like mRNA interferase family)